MQIQLPEPNHTVNIYLKHSWKDKVTVMWISTGAEPKQHVLLMTFDEFVGNYLKKAKTVSHTRAEAHFVIKSLFLQR